SYTHGTLAGFPALTRHSFGKGHGWYLSTRLDDADYTALVVRLLDSVGVGPVLPGLPPGVEAVTRQGEDGSRWHIVLNHRAESVSLPDAAHDLLTGGPVEEVPAGGCVVLRAGKPL
ncbi:MAG: beta-galactosidase, partial [Pseudonocardiales bacterium]|nr:beta-galactosidase [Pseudonocardiales bacterium]